MHGLFNRSLQNFLSDSFGAATWRDIALASGLTRVLGPDGFEAMQVYDDALTESVLSTAASVLRRPRDSLLEDLGIFLVSNPRNEPLRRLLRFGGVSFTDFLYSLDDLQGRSRLAVPDLAMPDLWIEDSAPGRFTLVCRGGPPGFAAVLTGILRALADDYGALAVIEQAPSRPQDERIDITVHDPAFHAGRAFDLAAEAR